MACKQLRKAKGLYRMKLQGERSKAARLFGIIRRRKV